MTQARRWQAIPGAVLVGAILAGCGIGAITPNTTTVPGGQQVVRSGSHPPACHSCSRVTAEVRNLGPSGAVVARREATRILAALRLPVGCAQSSSPPSGTDSQLGSPDQLQGNALLVDLHRFFVVPQGAQDTLAWIQAHVPKGATMNGTSAGGNVSTGNDEWGVDLSWHVHGSVLDTADLYIEAVNLRGSDGARSALRVDSEVTWLPAKNTADFVPGGVTSLTVSAPGATTVSTSDRRVTNRFRTAISRLPVMPDATFNCPADFAGGTATLVFSDPNGREAAVVQADRYGCGTVEITVGGHKGTTLWDGARIVLLAEHLLGLRLHVY